MLATLQQLLLFALAAGVVIAAPGPDNLGTLGIGLSRGRAPAVSFAIGCALGCLTHTLWAAIGVSVILQSSAAAFLVFKIAGACYLLYLGVMALRSSGATITPESDPEALFKHARYLMRGFISNAINPKVALFFLAFLPQFVRTGGPSTTLQIIYLGLTFAVMTAIAFSLIGLCAGRIGAWLRARPTVSKRLDQLTGLLFIALGVRLLLQRR